MGGPQHRLPPPAFSAWPHALSHVSSRAQSRAPSQMSGLDVAGLLNRLVDRQHDDLQQAVQQPKAEAAHREHQLKAEAAEREKQADQREHQTYQREQAARAEEKAEALQRERQIRSDVEHEARRAVQLRERELEIDRLRRKLAKKEAKEYQPRLSSASHLVGAPTPSGVGPTEEVLVAVLNREMDRRRLEEEQRVMEDRREQQLEADRLRRQSMESSEPRLEKPPTVGG